MGWLILIQCFLTFWWHAICMWFFLVLVDFLENSTQNLDMKVFNWQWCFQWLCEVLKSCFHRFHRFWSLKVDHLGPRLTKEYRQQYNANAIIRRHMLHSYALLDNSQAPYCSYCSAGDIPLPPRPPRSKAIQAAPLPSFLDSRQVSERLKSVPQRLDARQCDINCTRLLSGLYKLLIWGLGQGWLTISHWRRSHPGAAGSSMLLTDLRRGSSIPVCCDQHSISSTTLHSGQLFFWPCWRPCGSRTEHRCLGRGYEMPQCRRFP